jgi:hypothetical protein
MFPFAGMSRMNNRVLNGLTKMRTEQGQETQTVQEDQPRPPVHAVLNHPP